MTLLFVLGCFYCVSLCVLGLFVGVLCCCFFCNFCLLLFFCNFCLLLFYVRF